MNSTTTTSTTDIFTAWAAARDAHPGPDTTLDIEGSDSGGWYLVWDHPDWDHSYPLDALASAEERDARGDGPARSRMWWAMAHDVFCPIAPLGMPGMSFPHAAWLTRAGHWSMGGDDGRGYDNGERTYSWQTLDALVLALSLVIPADELRAITGRWVEWQACKVQQALEKALPPALNPLSDAEPDGEGHRVAVPSGRERLGLGAPQ